MKAEIIEGAPQRIDIALSDGRWHIGRLHSDQRPSGGQACFGISQTCYRYQAMLSAETI